MRDVKLALRTLFRTPFVTVVAILSLALGIGANAAIYSLFDQILLRPLPVRQPDRLVNFAGPGPQYGSNSCNSAGGCDEVFSYPMFRDLERAKTAFSGIAGHFLFGVNVAMAGKTAINGRGVFVSGSYFPVLGIRPAIGRLFTPNDDQTIGGHYMVVLSYEYWTNQLGADPAVLGRQLVVNGHPMTILGVAPEGFSGTTKGERPYVFVPITMRGVMNTGWTGFEDRQSYWVYLFGRLRPGATIEQASASINPVYSHIINDVEAPLQKGMSAKTLAQFKAKKLVLSDGRKGQSLAIRESRTPLVLLFSITAIVLLIACANIANLLLARAANRTMEMAVRLSLGATRRQLIAQVLTESVLLAILGGLASVVVAHWTLMGIMAMLPPEVVDIQLHLSVTVLVFTALVSLGTGLAFGIVPALHSTRPDLVTELRNNSGKLTGGRGAARFRTSLVTAQIALSMALLIAAGLFIESLRNVSRVDLGIKIDDVVSFAISPGKNAYDSVRTAALYARVGEELASIPGVSGVTSAIVPLLAGSNWGTSVSVEGFQKDPDTDAGTRFNAVGPNYFHVVGVPLIAGRDFIASDNANGLRVAIVNEAFAKKFKLGMNAVGKRLSVGNDSLNITIVGLAKDAKYSEVKDKAPPLLAEPYRQMGRMDQMYFYIRSTLPTDQLLRAIPQVIKKLDATLPVERLTTLPQQVHDNVFLDRMITTLSAAFAALATLLAAVGLYGVLAYSVAQRTREIGVRMALGATAGSVSRMVLRQVGIMTLVGAVIGIAGALALGRGAQSLLYELRGWDPTVIAVSVVLLTLVALASALVPALRASRVDPMQALRYE